MIYNLLFKAGINIRPGARSLLEDLVNDFEIIVFTASH
jgi:CTD small phosphatase-like protein 2